MAQVGLASRDSQALASVQESGSEAQVDICYGGDQVPGLVWEATLFLHVLLQVMLMTCFPTFWRMQDGAILKKLP